MEHFDFQLEYLAPLLAQQLKSIGSQPILANEVFKREAERIYSFQLFTQPFCQELSKEIDRKSALLLTKLRPNTQHAYGVVLNEIGLQAFFDKFLLMVLNPIVSSLFGNAIKHPLTQHHATVVSYRSDHDTSLHLHSDESEVTLNLCLGGHFEGSDIIFRGLVGSKDEQTELLRFKHRPGTALLHLGDQMHEVLPLERGERRNLVLWAAGADFGGGQNDFYEQYRKKDLRNQ